MTVLAPAILLALALGGQPRRAEAQHLPERTFAVASASAASAAVQPLHWASDRPRAWPYVLTGAVLGAAAMGVGLVLYFDGTEDTLMSPFALLPAFAGSAAVGGALGYVVYRIRL